MNKPTVLYVMRDDGDMTEPMNIMLLSALGQQKGFRSELCVLEHHDLAEMIKALKPEIVAMSAITGSHQALLSANRTVKKIAPETKTVIGGPFATFRPQIVREEPFDAVGIGECDEAWPALLEAWNLNQSIDDIHNIVTPENASRVLKRVLAHSDEPASNSWRIVPEHLRPRMVALDDLPFMDRELIYTKTAFAKRYKRTMMAGRGCPFRCTYCFEHAWNDLYRGKGKTLQRHSVERLCAELQALKTNWDTRFIKFYDDVFPVFDNTDDRWLEEFAETYPRMVGLPFHCLVRAEQVTEHKLRLLKQAGIASITMSIESGNPFVRDYVLIRDMDDTDLRNGFDLCRKLRIPTFANTILAVPAPTLPDVTAPDELYEKQLKAVLSIASEVDPQRKNKRKRLEDQVREAAEEHTDEQAKRLAVRKVLTIAGVRAEPLDYDRDSVRYNQELGVSFGEYPVFFPYAGTQLGAYAVRHGYFDGNYDRLHASYQTVSPLDNFTPQEKLEQQNLALLGTVLNLFTGSYNPLVYRFSKPATWFAIKVLAPLPLTDAYLRVYSAAKNWMHTRRIYPMAKSVRERIDYFVDNYGLDRFKQTRSQRWLGVFAHRGDRPGQTLGGPPSV